MEIEVGKEYILISYAKAKEMWPSSEWVDVFQSEYGWDKKAKVIDKGSRGIIIEGSEFKLGEVCFESDTEVKLNRLKQVL